LCAHWSSTRGSYTSPHICFHAIDHILGFQVETISWSKIRRCYPSILLKMVVHGYFRQKWGLSGRSPSTRGSYSTPHKCFLAIDHILGFLVEIVSWTKIHWCYSSILFIMVVHAIFDKNGDCVATDHRPDARTSHPTYVSMP
jgi:hypothetical protein